ncbi:MAG TPA: S8 family peptidase [Jiangellaceae bacterium]
MNADSATAIESSYIVVLEETTTARAAAAAADEVQSFGGDVRQRYSEAIDGFAATLSDDQLAELRADPRVAYVEADQTVTATGTQTPTPSWGLDRTDQRDLPLDDSYTYATSGAGVTAYVVDTGIYSGHADFGGRVTSGYDAIGDGNGTEDCQGHGTHVAGTIGGSSYGLAKDVALVAVRVLDCGGSGSTSGVIAGVDWVAANHSGPSVANMSLGGGASQSLDDAVAGAVSAGVTFAVAAGNDYGADACGSSPARESSALTVGSSTSTDAVSDFSNVGSGVDIFGPGTDITSSWIGSPDASNEISGTSMATPHVAGVAALYLSANSGATPQQVGDALTGAGTPDTLTGVPSGTVNLLLHYPQDWSGGPGEPGACADSGTRVTGALDSGGTAIQPESGSFDTAGGALGGCLSGPDGTDFDLRLQVADGSSWRTVASSLSWTSEESIAYDAAAGTYRWVIEAYDGTGEYTFGMTTP